MKYPERESRKWYAVYVRSRTEKRVTEDLERHSLKVYLPLIKTLRQWSDRKRKVEIPLFNSYVFVYISNTEKFIVKQTPNVVRFVSFEGKETEIPESQIMAIRLFVAKDCKPIDPAKYAAGQNVEVISGSMKGLRGMLIQVRGRKKVMVMIADINKSIYLDIHPSSLKIV